MNNIEIWKPILGYEGLYEVSNLGNIKSLINRNKILKRHNKTSSGKNQIVLYKNGFKKTFKIDKLVAEAFIANYEKSFFLIHKDGNNSNDNVDNLKYDTIKTEKLCKDKLIDLHIKKKKSLVEIANIFNVKHYVVLKNMEKYDIKVNKYRTNKYGVTEKNILELLKDKTIYELALELGCDESLLYKYKNKRLEMCINKK